MPDFNIAGIVLAAGDSRRMGRPKALLTLHGKYFIDILLTRLQTVGCVPLVSVLGRQAQTIRRQTQAASFTVHTNPRPQDGMLSSLKIALRHLPAQTQGFLLAPVDHPMVAEATYRALIAAAAAHYRQIVIPSFQGRHGHPVYFGRPFFKELIETPQELGAQAVVAQHRAEVYYLEVDDQGVLQNIDTPTQYNQLIHKTGNAL